MYGWELPVFGPSCDRIERGWSYIHVRFLSLVDLYHYLPRRPSSQGIYVSVLESEARSAVFLLE